jgi:hypothetical protein
MMAWRARLEASASRASALTGTPQANKPQDNKDKFFFKKKNQLTKK